MIEGVFIKPLSVISSEKGKVMHMMRSDAYFFKQFGEIYFSTVNPQFIKGWKKHLKITQHFAVPFGKIKLVLYDDRTTSPTMGEVQEIDIGSENYQLVRIPPLIWYAFKATGNEFGLIANCTDLPYDPEDIITADPFDKSIPYDWNR